MIHQFFSWLFVGNVVPLQKTRLTNNTGGLSRCVPLCLWFQDIANSGAFLSLELS